MLCSSSAPSCSQSLQVVKGCAVGAVPIDALPSQQQMDGTRQHSWAQFAANAGGGTEPLGQQNSSHLMQALLAQRMESQGVSLPGSTAGMWPQLAAFQPHPWDSACSAELPSTAPHWTQGICLAVAAS